MENRIDEQPLGQFAYRTSTATMRANQLRLWLSAVGYALVNHLRHLGLRVHRTGPRPGFHLSHSPAQERRPAHRQRAAPCCFGEQRLPAAGAVRSGVANLQTHYPPRL